jgi:hypothetical protein
VVPGQQPLPQHGQEKGAYCGLQDTIHIDRAVVELHVPPHFEGPIMVLTHQHSRKEDTTTPLPTQKAELFFAVGPQILKVKHLHN